MKQFHPFAREQRKSGLSRREVLSKEEPALFFTRTLLVSGTRALVHKAIYKMPTMATMGKMAAA
ncbi:hypothetical protein [Bartonella tribocorum]|uniref:Uncharacterized protein n=1 Tax=Bartonella tribocorum TaxID=85701 RepID=A0A2M6UQP2_9HYPH|nr:hypothetical protein [Bartonella tribocorum]PIT68487.1 hypothetical protein CER18_06975 [Bartonella tribocorum]